MPTVSSELKYMKYIRIYLISGLLKNIFSTILEVDLGIVYFQILTTAN